MVAKIKINVRQTEFCSICLQFMNAEQFIENTESGFDIFAQKTRFFRCLVLHQRRLRGQLNVFLNIRDERFNHLREVFRIEIFRQFFQHENSADARGDCGFAIFVVLRKQFNRVRKSFVGKTNPIGFRLPIAGVRLLL